MKVHARRVVATPAERTCAESSISAEKWRREIAFPGFEQVEVGDAGSKWTSRNLDFQPRVVSLMERSILVRFDLLAQEEVGEVRSPKKKERICAVSAYSFRTG